MSLQAGLFDNTPFCCLHSVRSSFREGIISGYDSRGYVTDVRIFGRHSKENVSQLA